MAIPTPHLKRPAPGARALLVLLSWCCVVVAGACAEPEPRVAFEPVGGGVAAGTPAATRIGQEILNRGGNAADAAVAVSLALAVSEPGQSGLGGSAVALVRAPGEDPVVIHAPETVLGEDGPAAIVPALLPVLERLWEQHGSGTMEWEELVAPAVRLAEEGFTLGRLAHRTLVQEYPRLLADERLSSLFLTENLAIHAEGSVLTRPELAATLRTIGREGPGDLYSGELAEQLLGWAARTGFPLDRSQLTGAPQIEEVPAARGSYGPWTVWAAPEPFAGQAVLRGLEFLSRAPPGIWNGSSRVRTPWVAEALAWAFGTGGSDVDAHMASLPRLPVPAPDTTPSRTPRPDSASPGGQGSPSGREGSAGPTLPLRASTTGETTHFSIIDDRGGVVSMSQTLGAPYGAALPAADLGFVFGRPGEEGQSAMPGGVVVEDAPDSDAAAADGAEVREEATPGARRWMSPVLATRDDSTLIALGSPGGPRGISAVVQVLAAGARAPHTLQQVVSDARIHVGPGPEGRRARVYLEGMLFEPSDSVPNSFGVWGDSLRVDIDRRGFLATERDTGLYFQGVSPWFGGVNAVARVGESYFPAADPRRDGIGRRTSDGTPEFMDVRPGRDGEGRPPPLP